MKTNTNKTSDEHNSAPAHFADCGRVRASVWQSEANGTLRFKITISRSFNEDGVWKRGRTFFGDELAAVVEVVARAQRWIQWRKRDAQAQLPLMASQ
jgi:hypothetical protein